MDIVGKVVIEKHRDGVLIERRETKNVLRSRAAMLFLLLGWRAQFTSEGANEIVYTPGGRATLYHFTRLVLANVDKTTVKYMDYPDLTREEDTVNMRWKARMTWIDTSLDAYTVGYIGLLRTNETPTVGADNITGSPDSLFAAKIDPPITKAAEDLLNVTWTIEIPYGEVP